MMVAMRRKIRGAEGTGGTEEVIRKGEVGRALLKRDRHLNQTSGTARIVPNSWASHVYPLQQPFRCRRRSMQAPFGATNTRIAKKLSPVLEALTPPSAASSSRKITCRETLKTLAYAFIRISVMGTST